MILAKRLTDKQKEEIIEGFINGKTIEELSIKFSCTKLTISRNLKKKFGDKNFKDHLSNKKSLNVKVKDFIQSIERVITVSIDRKESVKVTLEKDNIQLFVNSSSSGEGRETLAANYNDENLTVSFNSRYLLDIASEIEDEKIIMNFNDPISPVLIQDDSDKHSYYVIMPMKI